MWADPVAPDIDDQRAFPGQAKHGAGAQPPVQPGGERGPLGEGLQTEGTANGIESQIDCQLEPFRNRAACVAAQESHVAERWRSAKHLAPHHSMSPADQLCKRGADGHQYIGACAALGEDVQQLAMAISIANQIGGYMRAGCSDGTRRGRYSRVIDDLD